MNGDDNGFAAYQLDENPFGGRWLYELEPKDRDYYAAVNGFGKAKSTIDSWMPSEIVPVQFAFIAGFEGCGHTSVANYIIDAIARNRVKKVIKVGVQIQHNDSNEWMHSWMRKLVNDLSLDWPVIYDEVKQYANEKIGKEPHDDDIDYKGLVERVARQCLSRDFLLAAVFEDVLDIQFVNRVMKIFRVSEKARGCVYVVFTTLKLELAGAFEGFQADGLPPVRLTPLDGNDVGGLVQQRWQQLGATGDLPFAPEDVKVLFDTIVPPPIKRATKILAFLFDKHAETIVAQGGIAQPTTLQDMALWALEEVHAQLGGHS